MKRLFFALLALCLLTGCMSAVPVENVPVQETASVPRVYTNWSRLTPYTPAEEQHTYAETYSHDGGLQPSDSYGVLLPYIGSYLKTESYMGPLCTLGLVTADGRLVTPPVYAQIEMVRNWSQPSTYAPFLLLYQGEVTARRQEEWGSWVEGDFKLTVAAPDGSWIRELPPCHGSAQALGGDRLALTLEDRSVLILDADGNTAMAFPASALEVYLGEGFTWWNFDGGPSLSWNNGVGQIWKYDETAPDGDHIVCWLDPDTGAVTADPPPDDAEPEAEYQELPELPFYGYNTRHTLTDPVTGDRYCWSTRTDDSEIRDLLNEEGQVILENCELPYPVLGIGEWCAPWVWAERIACSENGMFCYYDLAGNCVFRRTIQTNLD